MKRLLTILSLSAMSFTLFAGINHATAAYLTASLPGEAVLLPIPPIQQLQGTSCGEAALVMAHNYAHPDSPLDEASVIKYAALQGYYTWDREPYTSPADMVRIAAQYNNNYISGNVFSADQGLALLLMNLEQGTPVILDVLTFFNDPSTDAHFVLVTGVAVGPEDAITVFYNDPFTGRSEASPWAGDDGLWNAWQNNGDPGGAGWYLILPRP